MKSFRLIFQDLSDIDFNLIYTYCLQVDENLLVYAHIYKLCANIADNFINDTFIKWSLKLI